MTHHSDIVIVGAGPGGCSAALKLAKLGVPSTLIDKSTFPRDKVCGDTFDGAVAKILSDIAPTVHAKLGQYPLTTTRQLRVINKNGRKIELNFKSNAFPRIHAARIDFDAALMEEVEASDLIATKLGSGVNHIDKSDQGWILTLDSDEQISCAQLVWSAGTNAPLTQTLRSTPSNDKPYFVYGRQYYDTAVANDQSNGVELYVGVKPYPYYITHVPRGRGRSSIIVGLRTTDLKASGMKMKDFMDKVLTDHLALKDKFLPSKKLDKLKGASQYFSSTVKEWTSGDILLVGDSSGQVNPILGWGVSHAMAHGVVAAEVLAKWWADGRDPSFSASKQYASRIQAKLRNELRYSRVFFFLARHLRLVNWLLSIRMPNWVARRLEREADVNKMSLFAKSPSEPKQV